MEPLQNKDEEKRFFVETYLILDVMVAADQGCGCSDSLFSREVGIWKTTCDNRNNVLV